MSNEIIEVKIKQTNNLVYCFFVCVFVSLFYDTVFIEMCLDSEVAVCVSDVFQKSIVLFANEWFLVMTSNIVPIYSIVVELIQKGQTVLMSTTLFVFTVVWLWQTNATRFGPITLATVGGWCDFLQFSCPKPSVGLNWLQVWAVTSFEIAHSSAGPDVFYL